MDYFYRTVISHVISAITQLESAEYSGISLTIHEVDLDSLLREFKEDLEEYLPENSEIISCRHLKCLLRVNNFHYIITNSYWYDTNCEDFDEVNVSMMINRYDCDVYALNAYNSI